MKTIIKNTILLLAGCIMQYNLADDNQDLRITEKRETTPNYLYNLYEQDGTISIGGNISHWIIWNFGNKPGDAPTASLCTQEQLSTANRPCYIDRAKYSDKKIFEKLFSTRCNNWHEVTPENVRLLQILEREAMLHEKRFDHSVYFEKALKLAQQRLAINESQIQIDKNFNSLMETHNKHKDNITISAFNLLCSVLEKFTYQLHILANQEKITYRELNALGQVMEQEKEKIDPEVAKELIVINQLNFLDTTTIPYDAITSTYDGSRKESLNDKQKTFMTKQCVYPHLINDFKKWIKAWALYLNSSTNI